MSTAPATPAPETPAEPALAAAELARLLDIILASLLNSLWTRALYARLLGPLATLVWQRIARTRERLARALAHIAAGRAPRLPRPHATPRAATPCAPFPNRRHGWLGAMLDHAVRSHAAQLGHLLARPGVAEIIAASPGALRTLRPLCRMLGADLPKPLRLPPRPPRPRPVSPPRPKPAAVPPDHPGTPDRPLQPYVRAAMRAWNRPLPQKT
jgi:hypothetical protein